MEKFLRDMLPILEAFPLPTTLSSFSAEKAEKRINLAKCENCAVSSRVMAALADIRPALLKDHWDPQDHVLRAKLARLHGVDREQVLLVSGGNGGIRYTFEMFTTPGMQIGLLKPDYPFWYFSQRSRTTIAWLENRTFPFRHEPDDIVRFVQDQSCRFVILSNPNGGLGTKKTGSEIETIVRSSPGTVFVIDESDAIDTDSAADLTVRHENVIVIRSFSKFYGLSGLRIGYIVVPVALSEHFKRFIDFLELTGTRFALSPKHRLTATVSLRSF